MRAYHAELIYVGEDDGGFLVREHVSVRAETEEEAVEKFDVICHEKEADYWDFV